MAVPAHWCASVHLLRLDPQVELGVEDAETAVVLLAVVAAEDPELAAVERRCVVLNLRRAVEKWPCHRLGRVRCRSPTLTVTSPA